MNSIIVERREKLLIIKLNAPKKKNALSAEMYKRISEILEESTTDDSVTIVAITGIGDFYSSGNDLSERTMSMENYDDFVIKKKQMVIDLVSSFIKFPKLLVAVVNGPCFGIAATTAVLCDIIYCSDTAYFQTPFTKLGLCAEGCSSYTFPKILGKSKASEMLMLDYKLTAEEALKYHFVSEIYRNDEIETKIWDKLVKFSKMATGSMQETKKLMRIGDKLLESVMFAEADALERRWYAEEFFNAFANFMASKNKSKL